MLFDDPCVFEAELLIVMHALECVKVRTWHHIWLEFNSIYMVRLLTTRSDKIF